MSSTKRLEAHAFSFDIHHADHYSTDKKEILVPLTNSLYVKGNISSPDRVLVDIGTGFYVEKVCLLHLLTGTVL